MRRAFHPILREYMRADPRIHLCVGDLGYRMWDDIAAEFPGRYHNVGASEQLMLGVGVGLALSGKIPVCFTITPFFWRCSEWIRNYLNHESVPVKLLGGGRDRDYHEDGFTHDASDDLDLFALFGAIETFHPERAEELPDVTREWLYDYAGPAYLNLRR